jgi:uncharacterized membrane protein YedE/YeeE
MLEIFNNMIETVSSQDHGSVLTVFLIGFFFGVVIQWTRVDTFEKIAGLSMLEDFTMIKFMLMTTGISTIGLYFMVEFGYAEFSAKPLIFGGLILGGLIFGVGMALFGKCPGTGTISLAEGRIDVLVGIAGGLLAGALFTVFYGDIEYILGENLGKIKLYDFDFISEYGGLLAIFMGILLIILSFVVPNKERHFDKE